MPSKVRIQFNSAGFRQILYQPKVWDLVADSATRIRDRAGEGFVVDGPKSMNYGGGRPGAFVTAQTNQAKAAEARTKDLTRAVRSI